MDVCRIIAVTCAALSMITCGSAAAQSVISGKAGIANLQLGVVDLTPEDNSEAGFVLGVRSTFVESILFDYSQNWDPYYTVQPQFPVPLQHTSYRGSTSVGVALSGELGDLHTTAVSQIDPAERNRGGTVTASQSVRILLRAHSELSIAGSYDVATDARNPIAGLGPGYATVDARFIGVSIPGIDEYFRRALVMDSPDDISQSDSGTFELRVLNDNDFDIEGALRFESRSVAYLNPDIVPVPEPAAWLLFAAGGLLVIGWQFLLRHRSLPERGARPGDGFPYRARGRCVATCDRRPRERDMGRLSRVAIAFSLVASTASASAPQPQGIVEARFSNFHFTASDLRPDDGKAAGYVLGTRATRAMALVSEGPDYEVSPEFPVRVDLIASAGGLTGHALLTGEFGNMEGKSFVAEDATAAIGNGALAYLTQGTHILVRANTALSITGNYLLSFSASEPGLFDVTGRGGLSASIAGISVDGLNDSFSRGFDGVKMFDGGELAFSVINDRDVDIEIALRLDAETWLWTQPPPVPEPVISLMLAAGLPLAAWRARRRALPPVA